MRLINRLLTDAPLIADGALHALLLSVQANTPQLISALSSASDPQAAEHPVHTKLRGALKPQATIREDGIAIVPVEGVLARKPDLFELFSGVEDSTHILGMVKAAANDPNVRGILLNVDSPGGFLTGSIEIADAVAATNKQKPVVAWTGGTMASMAYWIGSQAAQVVASRSAQVGSIGAFTTHIDFSKAYEAQGVKLEIIKNKEADYKAIGIMGSALSEEQRAHLQERVQASFKEFRRAVQTARPAVADDSMKGQVFYGAEAKKTGMIDRVGDMDFALSVLKSEMRSRASA
jgi:signal peptide peptidase SppA